MNMLALYGMKKFLPLALGVFIFAPLALRAAEVPYATLPEVESAPLYIYIPSINLLSTVEGVGIDTKGRMDVPSGRTNNVGWYEYGTAPGGVGTAVLDAHNTAAFKNLKNLPIGEEIYIYTSAGKWLHFAVTKAKTYSMKSLSPLTLFASVNSPQLNLITCAGTLLGNGEATHRLIVSAKLV